MKNFIRCIFSANFNLCLLTLIFFTVYQAANAQLPDPAKLVGGGTLCPNSPGIRFGITNYTAISHGLHGGYALTYHDPKRGAVLMGTIFPQADAQAGDTLYFNGLFTSEGSYELTVPIFGYGPGLLGYQYIHYKRLTLNQAISQSICGKNDGSLFFSINNADGPAAFALQLPTGQVVKQTDNGNFTGLNAGTYYLRVTDAAGCIINLPNVVVGRDKAVTVSTAATPTVNCSGIAASGSVLASVTGGAPSALAYKYAAYKIFHNIILVHHAISMQ